MPDCEPDVGWKLFKVVFSCKGMIGRDRSCFHRSDKAGTIFQGKLIRVSLTPQPDVSGSIVRYDL